MSSNNTKEARIKFVFMSTVISLLNQSPDTMKDKGGRHESLLTLIPTVPAPPVTFTGRKNTMQQVGQKVHTYPN